MVIPEIYPGIERESTIVGADAYEMYAVVDAIAHEYEFGSGEHMAVSHTQLDWFLYQAGMLTFRAFAQGKATWIQGSGPPRRDEESGDVCGDSRSKFLGRAGALDGRIE